MSDITVTASQVRPLGGALTRMLDAGEATYVGRVIRVAADGDAEQADASTEAGVTGQLGIIVAGARNDPDGEIVAGERITVVLFGPVYLGENASMDETKLHYASVNAGKIANARADSGAYDRPLGYPLSQTVLNFLPGAVAAEAYS